MELLDETLCSGIMNLVGQEVFIIELLYNLQKLDMDVWKISFSHINL